MSEIAGSSEGVGEVSGKASPTGLAHGVCIKNNSNIINFHLSGFFFVVSVCFFFPSLLPCFVFSVLVLSRSNKY